MVTPPALFLMVSALLEPLTREFLLVFEMTLGLSGSLSRVILPLEALTRLSDLLPASLRVMVPLPTAINKSEPLRTVPVTVPLVI